MEVKQINPKLIVGILALSVTFTSGWVTRGWLSDSEALEAAETSRNMVIEYANELVKKGNERDINQSIVNSLADAVRSTERVRFKFRPCKAGTPSDSDQAARLFSERLEKGFARLQERNTKRLEVCERINIDAIRSND